MLSGGKNSNFSITLWGVKKKKIKNNFMEAMRLIKYVPIDWVSYVLA
jgi:hypothetical protein